MTTLTDLAAWQDANDAYIAAATSWLRLFLMRTVPSAPVVVPVEPRQATPAPQTTVGRPAVIHDDPPASPPWWKFRRTSLTADPPPADVPRPTTPMALPPSSFETSQQAVDEARERMRAAEAVDPPPALVVLARRLGLSHFDRDLLLLCVAMELDTRIAGLCAMAQDDPSLAFPTFGVAFSIFDAPGWDSRSPEHPLRYWRLIELNQPWGRLDDDERLRAGERIVNYVKGLNHLTTARAVLRAGAEFAAAGQLPGSQQAVVDAIPEAPRSRPARATSGPASGATREPAVGCGRRRSASRVDLVPSAGDILPTQTAD